MYNKKILNLERNYEIDFDRRKFLRLDSNERVIPFSRNELSKFKKYLNDFSIQSYPSYRKEVKKLISKKENLLIENFTLTPGIDLTLKYIFDTFLNKKGNILTLYPTYGLIDVYANIYQKKLTKIYENNISKLNDPKILKNVNIVYLANPNSPSGKSLPKKILQNFIRKCAKKKIIVIIDETYVHFSKFKSLKDYINKFKNLIILRTFSKYYGLAGLRIGFIISNKKTIKYLNNIRPPNDLNHISLEILKNLLKTKDNYLEEIKKSKKYIIKIANKMNLNFELTDCNFFHIYFKNSDIRFISKKFFNNKILIKSIFLNYSKFSYTGPRNSIRVTIGSNKQMVYFFNILKKILKDLERIKRL